MYVLCDSRTATAAYPCQVTLLQPWQGQQQALTLGAGGRRRADPNSQDLHVHSDLSKGVPQRALGGLHLMGPRVDVLKRSGSSQLFGDPLDQTPRPSEHITCHAVAVLASGPLHMSEHLTILKRAPPCQAAKGASPAPYRCSALALVRAASGLLHTCEHPTTLK